MEERLRERGRQISRGKDERSREEGRKVDKVFREAKEREES